ncbi:MAG: VOC family protein [Clostridiales bacterium]|nr:VOC family protein [Clostridiales bacterium]
MERIVPHLWFDREAREAAEFYTTLFENSGVTRVETIHDTPSGDAETVAFTLAGQPFEAISAGPVFHINPSISLMAHCDTREEVDRLWQALANGGEVMMPLDAYPFNAHYGWIQDRYGLSWQLMFSPERGEEPKIVPSMLFSGTVNGKAEDAARYYTEVFPLSSVDLISRYAQGEAQSDLARVNYVGFHLAGQPFVAMDNGFDVEYTFTEAFSLIVYCESQDEIDEYWQKLSHAPEAEACGWVRDRFGVSWQIIPTAMEKLMNTGDEAANGRVVQAMLGMKKLDIQALQDAYDGR